MKAWPGQEATAAAGAVGGRSAQAATGAKGGQWFPVAIAGLAAGEWPGLVVSNVWLVATYVPLGLLLVVRAGTITDAAGNTSAPANDSATKDTVPPEAATVTLSDPVNPRNQTAVAVSGMGSAQARPWAPQGQLLRAGTMASISVDDEDPATAVVAAMAPVSASGYSATLDLSSLSNGTLTATVTLTDAAASTGPPGTDTARKVGPPVHAGPRTADA